MWILSRVTRGKIGTLFLSTSGHMKTKTDDLCVVCSALCDYLSLRQIKQKW